MQHELVQTQVLVQYWYENNIILLWKRTMKTKQKSMSTLILQ